MREEAFCMEHVTTEDVARTNLHNFHLQVYRGELVGLICINDRGKDKLLELLQYGGEIKFGRVYCREKMVNSYDYDNGQGRHVYVIGYKSHLVDDLTVAENIFVIRSRMKKYFLNRRVLKEQTAQHFAKWQLHIDPEKCVKQLTVFERCAVELMKAVFMDVALIVINDVANILSAGDLERFQKLMFRLLESGYSILYIGSWQEKLFYQASRTAFMQDGTIIKILDGEDYGKEKAKLFLPPVQHGDLEELFHEGDFSTKQLMDGEMYRLLGKKYAVIPENPTKKLLFYHLDYLDNLCFGLDEKLGRGCNYKRLRRGIAAEWEEELGEDLLVDDIRTLSKYSLYRLVYYKMLIMRPEVVVCINPFADCDLYLQGQVMEWLGKLKEQGVEVFVMNPR